MIDLSLVIAHNLERDSMVEGEVFAAVKSDKGMAVEIELDGHHSAGLVLMDVGAGGIVALNV
jgi:hypothetical protein